MADAETGRSGRERSRDRSQTREDPQEPRLSGGGLEDRRLSRLETQVSELSQALLTLGPAVQQILQLQQAQQVNPNMPIQRPEPPTAAPPPPFNPGTFPQTPGSADVSNAQPSQASNPNVIDPNVVNASGSQPSDPWQVQDPWKNFHPTPAQAAGIPDQPSAVSYQYASEPRETESVSCFRSRPCVSDPNSSRVDPESIAVQCTTRNASWFSHCWTSPHCHRYSTGVNSWHK